MRVNQPDDRLVDAYGHPGQGGLTAPVGAVQGSPVTGPPGASVGGAPFPPVGGPSFPPPGGATGPSEPAPITPRAITLSLSTVLTALLLAICALVPVPYAISSPGPTRDTLGEVDGEPLIEVTGVPTYPSTGKLLLTTVSVSGGPGYPVGIGSVLQGWAEGAQSVVPVEEVFAPTESR